MKDSDIFRENAENCLQLAENAPKEQASVRYRRMASAWTALADEQDWLDGHSSEHAIELAGTADDLMEEKGTTKTDIEDRRRRLIEGLEEFRDRGDQDK